VGRKLKKLENTDFNTAVANVMVLAFHKYERVKKLC